MSTDPAGPPPATRTQEAGLEAAGGGLAATVLGEEVRGLRVALERQRRPWWRRIVGG